VALTLVSPLAAFRELVEVPRSLLAMALLIAAHLAVPAALRGKVDVRRAVLSDLADSGKLADTTEVEINENVAQSEKIQVAKYAALGLFGPPFATLLLTIGMWLWGRFLAVRPAFGTLWSLCAHAQVPLAIRSLAQAFVIFSQPYVFPDQIDGVLPSGLSAVPGLHLAPLATSLLGGVDFFRVWTAVLLGVALFAASKTGVLRAALGMTVAYAIFVVVTFVGLPRLAGA
jgi:hypothetical protein